MTMHTTAMNKSNTACTCRTLTFDGFDGDGGRRGVPVAADALRLGFEHDAERSFTQHLAHQQPARMHRSTLTLHVCDPAH